MKRLTTVLVAIFGLISCASLPMTGDRNKFQTSAEKWRQIKETRPDYKYTISYASWAGFGNKTEVRIEQHRVVQRSYTAWNAQHLNQEQWVESESEIGQHKQGAAALNLAQLYDRCETEVLSQSSLRNQIELSFGDDGLLQACRYMPRSCVDDCSKGFTIQNLHFN